MALSETQRTEVRNILEMFRTLLNSYNALEDKSGINEGEITFFGFDPSSQYHEHHQLDYARSLVKQEFAEFKTAGTNANSPGDLICHWPMLPIYRKMLGRWMATTDKYKLTREDILRVTAQ